MRLDEACLPVFARHETFHPRLGWFRKAALAASTDSGGFFLAEDAPVRLGVGKNMVRSIKFWGTAARLIADVDHPSNSRLTYVAPTNLAVGLLGANGLDPYMERPATWWWLHWMILSPGCSLPVWWALFNEFHAVEFDAGLASQVCIDIIDGADWEAPHPSSIEKDVSAFLRTYAAPHGQRGRFDDRFGCPLRDLRVLTTTDSGFRFATAMPTTLPPIVLLAAVLDYLAVTRTSARSAALSRLATEAGSPARAFRLTASQLGEALEPAVKVVKGVSLSSPAGAVQLGWRGEPAELAHRILCSAYAADPDRPPVAGPLARDANDDVLGRLRLTRYAQGAVL
ncbi:MAG: DUF4007 family protein [Acidimicrobiia bacterium]